MCIAILRLSASAALALLMGASGCAVDESRWEISSEFTAQETAAIEAAAAEWRDVCGVQFGFRVGAEAVIRRVESNPCGLGQGYAGCHDTGIIEIADVAVRDLGLLERTARHELGHALGLHDRSESGYTMSYGSGMQPAALSPADCPR